MRQNSFILALITRRVKNDLKKELRELESLEGAFFFSDVGDTLYAQWSDYYVAGEWTAIRKKRKCAKKFSNDKNNET